MYAFGNRADTSAVDEPFYANYLSRVDILHPGQEEILQALPVGVQDVLDQYVYPQKGGKVHFVKNMAHHIAGLDQSFAYELENLFLIRNPKQLICSFEKVIPNPTMRDIGVKAQWEIFQNLKKNNAKVAVLDSNELLKNPKQVLQDLCVILDIPFDENMLHWEAGKRSFDGVWAPYWYNNVHKSIGFSKQRKKDRILPKQLIPLCEEANKYYNELFQYSIKAK